MYFFEQLIYEKDPPVIHEQEIQNQVVDPRQQALQQQKAAQEQQAQAEQQALQQQAAQQQAQAQAQAQQAAVPPTQVQTPEQQQYWSQYQDPQQNQDQQVEQYPDQADVLNSPASISIKRYFLIKKMFALNEKLNRLNMENDVLNFIINFIDSFSYEALLSITRRLVEEIYEKVKSPEQVKPKLEVDLSIS